MTGDDLIGLAGHLIVNKAYGESEARYRSAVSRAYYGAYHLVASFLKELGVTLKENHTGHQEAYEKLFKTGQTDAVAAARLLQDLRHARNDADYKLHINKFKSMQNAKNDVEMAGDCQQCIERCKQEPALSEIRASLKVA